MPAFQLLSDLHLETDTSINGTGYDTYTITPVAPFLILAGDIGELGSGEHYETFLWRHIDLFQHIYIVPGNHEFHHTDYDTALNVARAIQSNPKLQRKVTFLPCNTITLPEFNLTIIGATLYTYIPEAAANAISARVKDFSNIKDWDISKHNDRHKAQLRFIRQCIAAAPANHKVLVITHHAPTFHNYCAPQYEGSEISNAFATEILNASGSESVATWEGVGKVKVWAYGHTHYCTDWMWSPAAEDAGRLKMEGIHIVSNQRGYVRKGTESGVGFNPLFTFDV
ncbi:hypothetical protein BJ508DRAFT_411112 [Ascobolus immersus RN42]|uniref:Calcineurin-like phosphoesterase domain-containing protein n=1 Tax=Ascobolus immersus RN42 TaxID=1160509 RepID=A0A3N4IKJ6_ASCIM|nr:hypothetical protein BJ508DRAFT_411112 [Ascobolus immersus RN42]